MLKSAKNRLQNFFLNDDACKLGGFCELRQPAEKYGFKDQDLNYLINSFNQIGWSDPFPQALKDNQDEWEDPKPTAEEIYNYIEEVK